MAPTVSARGSSARRRSARTAPGRARRPRPSPASARARRAGGRGTAGSPRPGWAPRFHARPTRGPPQIFCPRFRLQWTDEGWRLVRRRRGAGGMRGEPRAGRRYPGLRGHKSRLLGRMRAGDASHQLSERRLAVPAGLTLETPTTCPSSSHLCDGLLLPLACSCDPTSGALTLRRRHRRLRLPRDAGHPLGQREPFHVRSRRLRQRRGRPSHLHERRPRLSAGRGRTLSIERLPRLGGRRRGARRRGRSSRRGSRPVRSR